MSIVTTKSIALTSRAVDSKSVIKATVLMTFGVAVMISWPNRFLLLKAEPLNDPFCFLKQFREHRAWQ